MPIQELCCPCLPPRQPERLLNIAVQEKVGKRDHTKILGRVTSGRFQDLRILSILSRFENSRKTLCGS